MPDNSTHLPDILKENEAQLLTGWVAEQIAALAGRTDLIKEAELKVQSKEFLGFMRNAVQSGNFRLPFPGKGLSGVLSSRRIHPCSVLSLMPS